MAGKRKVLANKETQALLDAVGRIYEAALEDDGWETAVSAVCDAMGAPFGNLSVIDTGAAHLNFYRGVNYDPDRIASYESHYLAINPFRRVLCAVSERVVDGFELVSEPEYTRSEFYNDWAKPQQLHYQCGYVFNHRGEQVVLLNIARPRHYGSFGEDDLDVLRAVAPHLKRALGLRGRVWGLSQERNALAGAMEALAFGVVLIDEDERPCHANAAARAALAAGEGLVERGRRLGASVPAESEDLRRLIHEAVQAGLGAGGGGGGGSVRLTRPSQVHPLLVQVYPLRGAEGDGMPAPTAMARAVLVISDPGGIAAPAAEVLRLAFGLTSAESRLVALLAKGFELREAAENLQISKETARNQLKAVFAKTDTHRQAELMRLVASLSVASGGPSWY